MTCKHSTVARIIKREKNADDQEVWVCDNPNCRVEFVPDPGPVYNLTLDGIAGTMSAVLWDYQERMHSKYGLGPTEPQPEQEHDCRDNRDRSGICMVCGDNPYL